MKTKYENVCPGDVFEIDGEKWLRFQGEVFRDMISYPFVAGPLNAVNLQTGVFAEFDWGTEVELIGPATAIVEHSNV